MSELTRSLNGRQKRSAERFSASVDLYDTAYAGSAQRVYQDVRRETYNLDLGQTGWMTAEEFRGFFGLLNLTAGSRVLEVGCGAGGCAAYLARMTDADVTGIDVNENALRSAEVLAESAGLESRLRFKKVDGGGQLPFAHESFDAIFSNDAMCHIPNRLDALEQWHRVLKPNGRMLFTDAMVVTGPVTSEELATRSSIGRYLFLPPGENERLIAEAGFKFLYSADLTANAAAVSKRWSEARARRRDDLIRIEGESNFLGLQKFLACVHLVSKECRLCRFQYAGYKPARQTDGLRSDKR
jgi:cyclopropane fatty-acyl-phospholipid synthase-like methyltransferase